MFDVTGPSRAYTDDERRLVDAGAAVEVVALQFDCPPRGKAKVRLLPWTWDRGLVLYLNGERVKVSDLQVELPAKPGLNRMVVCFRAKPGARKACSQLAVHTWGVANAVDCIKFREGE